MNLSPSTIAAIGVTNQRDTTLLWDKYTGSPLYNAISKYHFYTSQKALLFIRLNLKFTISKC